MEVQLNNRDARLFVSRNDIGFARYCASVLLKKGWHSQWWERRGTVYQQQAVYTTALVTAYGRAFTKSRGWSKLPSELLAIYHENELALHWHYVCSGPLEFISQLQLHRDSQFYSNWRAST